MAGNTIGVTTGHTSRTEKVTATNAAQNLKDIVDLSGKPEQCLITVEDNDLRIAFGGTTPVVDDVGHVVKKDNYIYISSPSQIQSLEFCNASAGATAVFQITVQKY